MTAPTTLPDALAEIEALRGQVRDLLRQLEQEAGTGAEGAVDSPEKTTAAEGFSAEPERKQTKRKAAQTALRNDEGQVIGIAGVGLKGEAYFRALIENSSDIITVLDLDGRIRFESPSFERLLGYKQHELDGRIAFEFLHPDDLPMVLEKFLLVVQRPGETHTAEFRFRHKDGSWLFLEGIGRSILDTEGQRCVIVNSRDITERKQAERALRASEQRFRAIFDQTFQFIGLMKTDGTLIEANRSALQFAGLREQDVIGKMFWDTPWWAHSPALQARLREAVREAAGGTMVRFEATHPSHTGEVAHIDFSLKPVHNERGEVTLLIPEGRDITERTQMEDALRRSETRLNEAQRLAHLGSWELDLTTHWLSWSDEIYRIFELDRERFGASYEAFLSIIHPDDRKAVNQAYTESVRNKTPYEIVHRLLMPDGRVKYVQERCETMYDAQGTPQRSFGTVQDITERMRLADREAARLEQVKKLSELGLTLSGDPAEIFERIVRMIGELFKVRVVCLSEIVGPELQFKAVYCNGEVVRDAGRCPLAITPCATVEMDKELRLFDRVRERFPQASFLHDHQAVSYCGFPALDRDGRVVAVTCLLDDKPREYTAEEQAVLRVFGQRIAIELERARYIAEQKRQAEEIRRSHDFIRQVIDTVPSYIFAKDRGGRYVLANRAVAEVYGTTVESLLGKTDADFNPNQEEVEFFRKKDREVMESLHDRFISEEKITDAAGKVHWLQTVKRPMLDEQGRADMVLGVATDITQRRCIEEVLRQRERDLRIALEERQRISEDLHDSILQSVYAVGLGLEALRPQVKRLHTKKDEMRLDAALNRSIGQLNQVMREIRHFIAGLESRVLQGGDFASALKTLVETLSASGHMACNVVIEEEVSRRLSTEQAFHLINIVREALSNSLRHSRAKRVTTLLKQLTHSIRLAVTDNGTGFNVSTARGVGYGLSNMEARVRKIGGRWALRSRPGRGTRIVIDLPEEVLHGSSKA